ncbi:F-box/FBD/LRR-repeat protein At1g16930-like [Mercurialis annua]|uniref:F-box/FBD/LRR-repeat protein At1g16930-like n=1 Tax=Mercurialis annua TaxID=3986 RepID=UPI0021610735|nr:F-box/FBD/LRR-repeat protein At1g16930-like [Mercurialis annua]XP_050210635.1 F-box/FBD/LRR-repeat protein At1g16930-like [Mercurialis annua]
MEEQRRQINSYEDRISKLPDEILSHILTLLESSVEAVRSSVLSKRWRYIWLTLEKFKIYDSYSPQKTYSREVYMNSFVNFMNRISVSNVKYFRLRLLENYSSSDIESWLSAIMTRNLEEIHLSGSIIQLPPKSVCLTGLKSLHLVTLSHLSDSSLEMLLSNCPILKVLDIFRSPSDSVDILNVNLSSLEQLVYYEFSKKSSNVVINAPNLDSLEICVSKLNIEVKTPRSIAKAYIKFYECVGTFLPADPTFQLLRKTSNISNLSVSCHILKLLCDSSIHNLPSLTRLKIFHCGDERSYLPTMLSITPNLKFIKFAKYCNRVHIKSTVELKPEQNMAKCLKSSLESLKFRGLENVAGDMEIVAYFLKYAKVLNVFAITCYSDDPEKGSKESVVLRKVSMFPRASSTCLISDVHKYSSRRPV